MATFSLRQLVCDSYDSRDPYPPNSRKNRRQSQAPGHAQLTDPTAQRKIVPADRRSSRGMPGTENCGSVQVIAADDRRVS